MLTLIKETGAKLARPLALVRPKQPLELRLTRDDSTLIRDAATVRRAALTDRIIALNPTATEGFLARFNEEALEQYLAHLIDSARPRGRDAWRLRPCGVHGIVHTEACA